MMISLTRGISWIALHWRASAVIACAAVGIAVTTRRCLETDEARFQREQRNRKEELRALADRISTYGRKVHQQYPTGDVVVSERDFSGTTSQAPRHCCHSPELALGRTKSPEGSAERILEAERLISIGDAILGIDSFCLGLRYTAAPPAQLPSVFSHAFKSQAIRLIEGDVASGDYRS